MPTLCLGAIGFKVGENLFIEGRRGYTLFRLGHDYQQGFGFTFLGARISQYPSPDNTEYETWVEVRVPRGRVKEKRKEGRQEEYLRAIKQQVRSLRQAIGDKVYVGDNYTHSYEKTYPPAEPEADEIIYTQIADEVKAVGRRHED